MRDVKTILKLVRNLLDKRSARRKEGRFVVEGPHLVEEAGDRIECLLYSEHLPEVKKLEEKGVPSYKISRRQFEEFSGVETPQGVLGVARQFEYQFREVLRADKTLVVFCLGVQDPGNLGTIIRSADAFGATGVILSKGTVDLYNPKVVRSTMGSLFHLPIVMTEDEEETIKYLKEHKVKIVAADGSARQDISVTDLKGAVAIMIGNEGAGLAKEVKKLADEKARIPMAGKAESLNVGIAASVLLYEALRQRA
ncbi:MAG: RNA methyltransferase [Candidatus Saganbacteria bacterium]|nr:RNA methyltransferase [Candidatus Saganbacteria bacterium]